MESEAPNRYRKAIRLPNFDYSGNATYFITICTAHRQLLFGEILGGAMILSLAGAIADEELRSTAGVRPEITMHHFVVMPNHVHALLTITPPEPASPSPHSKALHRLSRSLGSLVAGYKSTVTRQIREAWDMPDARVWQPNYYEHVVRNERAFDQIWEYIEHNSQRWSDDSENPGSPKYRP